MKKVIKRNQVIITSLAILIAVAGYLNFADVDLGFRDKEASADSSSILDQVDYDISDESALMEENSQNNLSDTADDTDTTTPGEAVLTGASGFAAQAKLSREQVRSQSKADLQEIINNADIDDEQKQTAINTMVEMTEVSEKEAAAEMLLEAKRREKEGLENMTSSSKKSEKKAPYRQERKPARKPSPAPQKTETADDDDFDYDKYLSGIDRKQDPNESEIDDILNEYRH